MFNSELLNYQRLLGVHWFFTMEFDGPVVIPWVLMGIA
jgi:hypothetical protein